MFGIEALYVAQKKGHRVRKARGKTRGNSIPPYYYIAILGNFFFNVYTDIKIRPPPYSSGHKTFENSFYALNMKAKNSIFNVYTVMKICLPPTIVVGIRFLKINFSGEAGRRPA